MHHEVSFFLASALLAGVPWATAAASTQAPAAPGAPATTTTPPPTAPANGSTQASTSTNTADPAASPNTAVPSAVAEAPPPPTTCKALSLFETASTSAELKALYATLAEFERAFERNDARLFADLVHPALTREKRKAEIFATTVQDYGLEKAKLARNALYQASFPTENPARTVTCPQGELRGVVGPTLQFAAMHAFNGGNEQIRLFTLFAPIPKSFAPKMKNPKQEFGIVMMFAQTWTHGKKAPEILSAESRKWSLLDEPITAWILAEASHRLYAANPYFVPNGTREAELLATQAKQKLPTFESLKAKVREATSGWEFLELAVIFQSKAVEVGVRTRMLETEEPVNAQIEKCKTVGRLLASEFPGITRPFSGFECMPYARGEATETSPEAGTQFHTWNTLKN